jgi:protein SEY1
MATRPRSDSRPQTNGRHPTAPTVLTMNGHFASIGEDASQEQYSHGIQVIDEDQNFK